MNTQKFTDILSCAILPLFLVCLFVIENQAFNVWLHVAPPKYWIRCALATFSFGILVYGISLFIRNRTLRHGYLFILSCILSLLLIAEFFYYSYSKSFLQVSALEYASQTFSILGTIPPLFTPKVLLFLLPPISVLISFLYHRSKKNITLHRTQKSIIGVLIIVIGLSGYGFVAFAETRDLGSVKGLFSSPYDTNLLIGKIGVVNYFFEGVIKSVLHSRDVTSSDKKIVRAWGRSRIKQQSSMRNFGLAKGRNLILIQVESLENATLHTSVEGQELTPNLNKLTKEGTYFPNYFAQIGHGTTADAEFMILNSLYSLPDSVAFVDYPKNSYHALPQLLAEHGYQTLVMHGDVATFWNRANIYPQLGYQTWIMRNNFTIPREVGFQGLGDADFFSQSVEKLKNVKKPFMVTLITLTSHTPFFIPDDLRTLKLSEKNELNEEQRHYLESIHYTDAAIGTCIENLKKAGLYDNSLILIYGDHGSFTQIGDALHTSKTILKDLAVQHIPLIILAPQTNLVGVSPIPASHIDLYPTVTNLLGLTTPGSVLGQDLFNTTTPVVTFRKPSSNNLNDILNNELSYIASSDGVFEHGSCSDTDFNPISIERCRELYETQTATLKASDVVIKANMIDALMPQASK